MTEINSRIEVLKELVRESHYVVDPRAVANAIILRSMARSVLPGVTFRSTAEVRPGSLVSAPPRSAVFSAEPRAPSR